MAASEARRLSDREWFEQYLRFEFDQMARATQGQLRDIALAQETIRSELAQQAEVLAIPTRDIPTVDELLVQAKADPTQRKLLEATLAELEFADPQIEFN